MHGKATAEDRFVDCLLGGAAGAPVEFMSLNKIRGDFDLGTPIPMLAQTGHSGRRGSAQSGKNY
jgi:hypothetical protein